MVVGRVDVHAYYAAEKSGVDRLRRKDFVHVFLAVWELGQRIRSLGDLGDGEEARGALAVGRGSEVFAFWEGG